MPVRPAGQFVHRDAFLALKANGPSALLPAPQQGKAAALVALRRERRWRDETPRREGF